MKKADARAIRQQAEQKLRAQPPATPKGDADVRALLHELQVHQIELEMQNEELLRAQTAAQEAADKYVELFDFAPVAYFVLDADGVIREVNLAGAALLGYDRSRVTGQPFQRFVTPESRPVLTALCVAAHQSGAKQTGELRLLRSGGGPCDVQIEGMSAGDGCRLAMLDVTARKQAQAALEDANADLNQFNKVAVGRELRMIELKKEINALCAAGQPPRYPVDDEKEPS